MDKVASRIKLHRKDHISQLADDTLLHILSFLTFREALGTRGLSKRWKNLWSCLDFDGFSALDKIVVSRGTKELKNVSQRERLKFVRWVDKVLQSHKALELLDGFRVRFDLDNSSQKAIDRWLQFAFVRKVQRVELDLSQRGMYWSNSWKLYTLSCCKLGLNMVDFKSLKELSLKRVNIAGEIINSLLHNCRCLERLTVHESHDLIDVEISAPSPALTHLEICSCYNMKSLIVRDANLVSLKITHPETLRLENVPMLVEVYVYGWSINVIKEVLPRLSCCLSKLEVLTLSISSEEARQLNNTLLELPQLKQLVLQVSAQKEDKSLLGLTSLVRKSPKLEKLAVKLRWPWGKDRVRVVRKFNEVVNYPLQHLKLFELTGYYGRTSELELVKFFTENAITLEKIIIDPREHLDLPELPWQFEEEQFPREYANKQLKGIIPPHVELEII